MNRVRTGLLLALISAVGWSFWTVLADVVDMLDKSNYVTFVLIAEVLVLLLSIPYILYYSRVTTSKRVKNYDKLIKYPILAGICYGFGNILFFGLVGNNSYPFVASVMFSNIIILSLLLGKISKQKIGALYVLGTIITVAGLIAEVFSLYGTDLSAAYNTIIYSVIMTLVYTAGYYFSYYYAYKGLDPIRTQPYVYLPVIAVLLAYGLITDGFSGVGRLTGQELWICFFIAVAIIIGYLAQEFAFRLLDKAKLKYLNLANIFVNLEIVGTIVFTVFFLSLSYQWLIAGLFLTLVGVLVVSYSK